MDIDRPGLPEFFCRLHRVRGHGMDGIKIPPEEPDAGPVLQINGWQNNHRFNSPKFFSMVMPTGPLFSGWNWHPKTLPFATMAATGPP